jgi:hypothetical protein
MLHSIGIGLVELAELAVMVEDGFHILPDERVQRIFVWVIEDTPSHIGHGYGTAIVFI